MSLEIKIVGAEEAKRRLDTLSKRVAYALKFTTDDSTRVLQTRIKESFGGPGFPRVNTGRLRRAIHKIPARKTEDGWQGQVGVLALVPYGRILELGGTIPAHDIYPVRKQALRWSGGVTALSNLVALSFGVTRKQGAAGRAYEPSDVHFAKHVHQEARQQRAIPFLAPAMEAERENIRALFAERVREALVTT